MNLYSSFYYDEKTEESSYSYEVKGQFVADRFLKGAPCWQKPMPDTEARKKKLILADWRAPEWSKEQVKLALDVISRLLDENFDLYVWQAGTIEKLDKETLATLTDKEKRMLITPAFPDEIIKIATTSKYKLTRDETFVLDDYWLQYVAGGKEPLPERQLDICDYIKSENKSELLELLKQSTPRLVSIRHSEFSANANQILATIPKEITGLAVSTHYRQLKLEEDWDNTLLAEQALTCNNMTFTLSELANIETLELCARNISSKNLKTLLARANKLKNLALNGCEILGDSLAKGVILTNLETLTLAHGKINSYNLRSLLRSASKLKTLDLNWYTTPSAGFAEGVVLTNLEELIASYSNIRCKDLQQLLKHAPGLKTLNLIACKMLDKDFAAGLVLACLETLNLAISNISGNNLRHILTHTPRLKHLNLSRCKNLDAEWANGLEFPELENLNITDSNISRNDFNYILKHTPNLKTLILSDGQILNDDLANAVALTNLESLKVLRGHISNHLPVILKQTSRLKSLDLSKCKTLGKNFTQDIAMVHLERLIVDESNISSNDLHNILAHASRLEVLSLSGCETIGKNFIQGLALIHLKKLNVVGSNISSNDFCHILAHSPRLKHLEFSGTHTFTEAFAENIVLADLEALNVSGSNCEGLQHLLKHAVKLKDLNLSNCQSLGSSDLRAILTRTPKLETLDLRGCQTLENDFATDIKFASLKTFFAEASNISNNDLKHILRHAPNLETIDLSDCTNLLIDDSLRVLLARIPYVNGLEDLKIAPDSNKPEHKATTAVDTPHNPVRYMDHKPTPKDFIFIFTGENKSKNQAMIIEKLSQYLTLTGQHEALIPRIQDGICDALTHLFSDESASAWEEFIAAISEWDGRPETLKHELLAPIFDTIIAYIKEYQFGHNKKSKHYIGDNLANYLASHPKKTVFNNPWHAVSVKQEGKNWLLFDPNFANGVKTCATEKELLPALKQSLGELISIEEPTFPVLPRINNSGTFIRDGGLIALCQCSNRNSVLDLLPDASLPLPEALSGLLLRNNAGVPAWVQAVKNPLTAAYTLSLLHAFIAEHEDWQSHLQHSIELMLPEARHDCLAHLRALQHDPDLINKLGTVLRHVPDSNYYEQYFKPWQKIKPYANCMDAFCQTLLQGNAKKQLVELANSQDVQTMHLVLENYCQRSKRPIFYVNSPEDLMCAAPFIKRDGNTGKIMPGPGGPLYDFLVAHQTTRPAPLILVNYEHFAADDIVRFNSLLDNNRRADGTALPESALVLGLINPQKPGCYQGEDFYSRFDEVKSSPFAGKPLAAGLPPLPVIATPSAPKTVAINLYNAPDWEERLLGRWVIEKDSLSFKNGELEKALQSGLPIEIQNGLWGNPKFRNFWQQALIRGHIEHAGRTIYIPPSLQLVQGTGYAWENLSKNVVFKSGLSDTAHTLNPGLLTAFFTQYRCHPDKHALETLPGLIAEHAGTNLEVNLTRPLTGHEWAMLLDTCQQHQVHLICHPAPGVQIPSALNTAFSPQEPKTGTWDGQLDSQTLLLASSDVDTSVAMLSKSDNTLQVIDVSECKPHDLLIKLHGELNKSTARYQFNESKGALLTALDAGKNILLKGKFSNELADALAPILLDKPTSAARLILVSESASPFNYLPVQQHKVDAQAKRDCLKGSFAPAELDTLDKTCLEQEPLSRLHARLAYCRHHPDEPTNNAWQGMESLPGKIQLEPFSATESAAKTEAFKAQRLSAVTAILDYAPYVYLSGLTAVGKTTFVQKELIKDGARLYQGEAKMREWATNTSEQRKILFIDEANLGNRQWSEFEGLYNIPPSILIDGRLHTLSANHKVVFAGNPVSYGKGRKLPPFLARHGNALLFNLMPQEFIYEGILKPVFANTALAPQSEDIARELLAVYCFLCEHTSDEVPISPRELQMMALLVLTHHKEHKDDDAVLVAQHYAYQLAKQLVPNAAQNAFKKRFAPPVLHGDKQDTMQAVLADNFLITASRAPCAALLDDLLALQQQRHTPDALNEAQRYGGLGGLVLEGAPGIGKSELVLNRLLQHGYRHVKLADTEVPERAFYCMPVSMSSDDKKNLLLKAFDEGAIVLIDEINSSPMMERLLNDLLMGSKPDGTRPARPGFMVIGTQNPVTMEGRQKPGTALARRLINVNLPEYNHNEMQAILNNKGLTADTSARLLDAYTKQRSYAELNHLKPAPTFRDVLRLTEHLVTTNRKMDKLLAPSSLPEELSAPDKSNTSVRKSISHTLLGNQPKKPAAGPENNQQDPALIKP